MLPIALSSFHPLLLLPQLLMGSLNFATDSPFSYVVVWTILFPERACFWYNSAFRVPAFFSKVGLKNREAEQKRRRRRAKKAEKKSKTGREEEQKRQRGRAEKGREEGPEKAEKKGQKRQRRRARKGREEGQEKAEKKGQKRQRRRAKKAEKRSQMAWLLAAKVFQTCFTEVRDALNCSFPSTSRCGTSVVKVFVNCSCRLYMLV